MKKRLLSAALALAMALTLLPVSVFATYDSPVLGDVDGNGTERVQYINYIDATHEKRGWYATHVYDVPVPGSTTGATTKQSKDVYLGDNPTGLSVNGMYYNTTNYTSLDAVSATNSATKGIYNKDANGNKTGLKGAVIVIGGSVSIDVVNATSITLDVYGGTATLTQTNTGGSTAKLTSVTVNNSQYATQGKGTINLASVASTLTSVTLHHVTLSDTSLTLNAPAATSTQGQTHSLILDDVTTTSTFTLSGAYTDAQGNANSVAQTVNISNKSTFGNITVTGNGSTVTLNNVPGNGSSTVSMTGIGGSFNFTGGGAIGGLTVTGDTVGGTGGSEVAGAPANISIGTDCTVASINGTMPTTEKTSGTNTVSISGIVGGMTNLKNSTVTISGGNISTLNVGAGTVTVSGNRSVVGNVTLARATFNLTGSNCTIGSLAVGNAGGVTADASKVTFTVPKDPSNTLGTTSASITGYTKKTISGGTWLTNVPAANLSDAVEYQLAVPAGGGANTFTYYTADQLGEAVLKQGATGGSVLIQVDVTSATQVVTFKNGAITWGELRVVPGTTIPQLPTQMNSVATPYWSDGIFNNLSGSYNTPNPTDAASPLKTAVTLDAGGGGAVTGTVTKLTGVKVGAADSNITASLVGNVITLSGAVDAGQKQFDLTLETDAVKEDSGKDVPVTIKVSVQRSGNTLTFVHPGNLSLGNGVVMENDFKTITLGNGTKYTLNGSGLVERNNTIKVVGLDSTSRTHTFSAHDIDVIVNVPGYNTDTQKQTIISVVNGNGASFTLTNSPAVQRAINAALATITESQVTQFRQSARQKAWSDNGTRGVALTDTTVTAYDSSDICLVPYLEVTVTDYKPATTASNATLTANLTLKWRVEIEAVTGTAPKANKTANLVSDDGTYIAKTGTALNFSGDLTKSDGTGGVVITFASGVTGATYAHQNGTYDYSITANVFTVTHAGNGNNLGTFVLDKVTPLVQLGAKPSGGAIVPGAPVKYYSTLQAAVDDAEDGQYILVDSAYGGSMNITMTGKAREIQIQANGKNVVVANASGGLVSENNTGSLYTIKLNRDNTVAVGNVDIAANTAQYGTITVSASKAKTGDVITITATPNQGYKVNTITAATNTGAAVAVSATGTLNQYTLTVPANTTKVTVTPTFVVGDNKATFSVNSNTRGTASVYTGTSDGKVEQGKSATVTVIPTSGNRTMGLTAYGNNGATAPVSRTGTNSFNVTVPSGATTVTVTPSFDVDNGTPFSDVLSNHWASNEISWAYRHGYTSGKDTAYTYKPADYITRGEVVAMLWKAANSPVVNYANPFKDVPTNYWAYNAVMWAASKGLIDTSTGYFNGTGYINRADTVVILYKHANSPTVYGTSGFADVASNAYYSRAVTWARQQGLTNGYSGNTYFRPSYAISRAEVATFLYRAFG